MSNLKQLQKQYQEATDLKTIAQAYSELSSSKLARIRKSMEHNISFAKELGDLYSTLRVEAVKKGLPSMPKKAGSAHILITSNNKFYGSLEKPLSRYFGTSTAEYQTEHPQVPTLRIVIGKTGPEFLKASNYQLEYQNILFQKDLPTYKEFKELFNMVFEFETILVYHSRFKTVLTQLPVISDITKPSLPNTAPIADLRYIFEPELKQILDFFETQILGVFLDTTFLESELARTAARLTTMDAAESNANDYLKAQKRLLGVAQRSTENAKMLEMMSSLSHIRSGG